MAESVPVRCPACRREHLYVPPAYPCPCGMPVALPLLRGGLPLRIHHRTWEESWVTLRCPACGRHAEWPRPELGCPCGVALRLPLTQGHRSPAVPTLSAPGASRDMAPARPVFQPVTIRTAQDAVTAAARYLDWLGFERVRTTGTRPASGVDLRGPEVLARVDPTTAPTPLQAIETLWLHGLNESAVAVCFCLAGYAPEARQRADDLRLPLFVLDLTGTPQPVNTAADDLVTMGNLR